MAELDEQGDINQMEKIYQMANKWIVIVQLPIFLVMVFFPKTLLSIFGEEFTNGTQALIIMAIANLIKVGTGMGGIIIDMTGYTKLKLVNSIIRLVIFITLDLLLIPKWGIVGAAVAILVGEGGINILRLLQVYVIYKILPFNKSFYKPILATVVGAIVVLVAGRFLPYESNYILAGLNMLLMMLSYAGIILLLGFTKDELSLYHALTANIKNKFNQSFRGR